MNKFERMTPDQQEQFDKEGTSITSQNMLSKEREMMVKNLEDIGKSGYVYKDLKAYPNTKIYGRINGIDFWVNGRGLGEITIAGEKREISINVASDLYKKYDSIAINKGREDDDIAWTNSNIEKHNKEFQEMDPAQRAIKELL